MNWENQTPKSLNCLPVVLKANPKSPGLLLLELLRVQTETNPALGPTAVLMPFVGIISFAKIFRQFNVTIKIGAVRSGAF